MLSLMWSSAKGAGMLWVVSYVIYYVVRRLLHKELNVRGQHWFITGGSEGLGLGLAQVIVARGGKVTIVSRSKDKLDQAKKSIVAQATATTAAADDVANRVGTIAADVTNNAAVQAAVKDAISSLGPIDVVVPNAGMALPNYVEDLAVDDFRRLMELNYMGTVHTIKAVLPGMIERRAGRVVIVSSAVCFVGFIGYSAYTPTKYAVRGLADCLRNELRGHNIDVHIFFPSNMKTPGLVEENKTKPQECRDIEGSSTEFLPVASAEQLLTAVADGQYAITQEALTEIGRISTAGPTPGNNFLAEMALAPLLPIIGFFYRFFIDYVVDSAAKKKEIIKKQKSQ